MTERWFGKNWGAPACDPNDHAPTPVGQLCMRCREPILIGQQGILMPFVHYIEGTTGHVTIEPTHLDCFLRKMRPHGPECPHCRGKERHEHTLECQRSELDFCSCMPIPPALLVMP